MRNVLFNSSCRETFMKQYGCEPCLAVLCMSEDINVDKGFV